jgi:hypothetical protein
MERAMCEIWLHVAPEKITVKLGSLALCNISEACRNETSAAVFRHA